MEWISAIRKSVEYIEEHLKDKIVAQDVADQLYMSQVHFQKGFLVMTGYSVAEYIRNRRLYLAALELKDNDKKVIILTPKADGKTELIINTENSTQKIKIFVKENSVSVKQKAKYFFI